MLRGVIHLILITGGAGYIGSVTAHRLAERGRRVVVFDNLSEGHQEAVPSQARLVTGDLRDETLLRFIFEKEPIDTVIHFAAHSRVGESMDQPLKYFADNVEGTRTLLKAMVDSGSKKLVFSSTAAVYGEPDEMPITEDTPTEPTNPYGESKLMAEKMLHWAGKAHGLKYVSLRYFNVAGAYGSRCGEDHRPETHLIPLTLQVALGQRDKLYIYGDDYDTRDGTCVRDFIHVLDLVHAHLLADKWLSQGGQNRVYNLGTGTGFTVKEVIEACRAVTGETIPTEATSPRPGDPPKLVASAQKARAELNWDLRFTEIEKIVASAWQWHKSHPRGYRE